MKRVPSPKDIKRLAQGEIPPFLQDKPFVILHYSVSARMIDESTFKWGLYLSPEDEDSATIDRQTALSIIRENGMSLALSIDCGQVYELPGKPFHAAYCKEARLKKAS